MAQQDAAIHLKAAATASVVRWAETEEGWFIIALNLHLLNGRADRVILPSIAESFVILLKRDK